jgi:hypothetical protein
MENNLRNVPTLRWQYYANESGYLFGYPAAPQENAVYDPRFRQVLDRLQESVYITIMRSGMSEKGSKSNNLIPI